ncbi:HU family DNA-binding protein [Streptomyces sp. 21So2-11]|uniref:HU family DNA-binding protein n=1 Tax=Streptomyces sp. 21So2-11 TaxID=3144408 RepID=UPI0032199F79
MPQPGVTQPCPRGSKSQATAAVEVVLNSITEAVDKGENVLLDGLKVNATKARRGRNPQTGKEIDIQTATAPAFMSGTDLKKAVKDAGG